MSQAAPSAPPPGEGRVRCPPRLISVAGAQGVASGLRRRLHWWNELLLIAAFYGAYSLIRNTQGSMSVSRMVAENNAFKVIDLERFFGLYHERWFQHLFVGFQPIMVLWNLFYGTFHFIVTAGVLIFLFRRFPDRYRLWRNTLAIATALALVGFAVYPLLPPRLLPDTYGFVDSLKVYGSLWSFDSNSMQVISNQYAAMPSLHFAWALWCGVALFPVLRHRWSKALAVLYPVVTLLAIVATANHFVLDAAGGAAALGIGWSVARSVHRRHRRGAEPLRAVAAEREPASSDA